MSEAETAPARRGFGDTMSAIFLPMLPALIGAGILQGIVSILVAFGVLQVGTPLHSVLSTISAAIFYFLPFLIAASTAKAFDGRAVGLMHASDVRGRPALTRG